MKCVILTPTTGRTVAGYSYSLFYMLSYFAHVPIGPQPQSLRLDMIEGSGISAAREDMVAKWLNEGVTHCLFIDEDMMFPPDALHKLAERDVPLVGVNYAKRAQYAGFTACNLDGKTIDITEDKAGIEPCLYTGFGFCLIRREVFEAIERPWFLIGYDLDRNAYTTEDRGFAKRVQEHTDITWYVDHDLSRQIIHVGNYRYKWTDAKEPEHGRL